MPDIIGGTYRYYLEAVDAGFSGQVSTAGAALEALPERVQAGLTALRAEATDIEARLRELARIPGFNATNEEAQHLRHELEQIWDAETSLIKGATSYTSQLQRATAQAEELYRKLQLAKQAEAGGRLEDLDGSVIGGLQTQFNQARQNIQTVRQEIEQFDASIGEAAGGLGGLSAAANLTSITMIAQLGQAALRVASEYLDLGEKAQGVDAALRAVSGSEALYSEALRTAADNQKRFGGTLVEAEDDILGAVRAAKLYNASIAEINRSTQLLASIDPGQGFQGAGLALREFLSGNSRSLAQRFELPAEHIDAIIKKTNDANERLRLLDQLLSQAGASQAALDAATQTSAHSWTEFKSAIGDAKNAAGSLLATLLAPTLDRWTASVRNFLGGFEYWGSTFSSARNWMASLTGATSENTAATQANTAAHRDGVQTQQEQNDAAQQAAQAVQVHTEAVNQATDALLKSTQQSLAKAEVDRVLTALAGQVANGQITIANASVVAANALGIEASAARDAIAALAQLAQAEVNAKALADQRVGERSGGRFDTSEQEKWAKDGERLEAQRERERQTAQSRQLLQAGTHTQKLAELRRLELEAERQYGKDSAQAIDAHTNYLQEANRKQKATGAAKLSEQQKLNNQMLDGQMGYQDKVEDAERDHFNRLLDIEVDYAKKSLAATKQLERSKRQSRADFYRSLTDVEDAGTQQQLASEYEQAFAKSQELAQAGNRQQAQDYLELKREELDAEREYLQARAELLKNDELSKRDRQARLNYLDGVRKLDQEAYAEQEKQLLEVGDAINNERQRQLEDEQQRYDEAIAKTDKKFDDWTERTVAKAVRAGKAISAPLVGAIEAVGQSAGGSARPASAAASSVSDALVRTYDQGVIDTLGDQTVRLESKLDAVVGEVRNVADRVRAVENAVHDVASRPVYVQP